MKKRVAMFLTRHYESIKLIMIAIILSICAYFLFSSLAYNNQRAEERSQVVKEILEGIKKENEFLVEDNARQTRLITCLLVIHGNTDSISEDAQDDCERAITNAETNIDSQAQTNREEPTSNQPFTEPSKSVEPKPEEPEESRGIIERINTAVENLLGIGG